MVELVDATPGATIEASEPSEAHAMRLLDSIGASGESNSNENGNEPTENQPQAPPSATAQTDHPVDTSTPATQGQLAETQGQHVTQHPGHHRHHQGDITTTLVDCPPAFVGRVIGKGGETIKGLQAQSGAHITIDQNFPDGVNRQIAISGPIGCVAIATGLVQELLRGGAVRNGSVGPGQAQRVVTCPKEMVGRVIGRGGETVKGLQSRTGARIQIDQSSVPCSVTITGNPYCVEAASRAVADVIHGGSTAPYSSANTSQQQQMRAMAGYGYGQGYEQGYGGLQAQGYAQGGAGHQQYKYHAQMQMPAMDAYGGQAYGDLQGYETDPYAQNYLQMSQIHQMQGMPQGMYPGQHGMAPNHPLSQGQFQQFQQFQQQMIHAQMTQTGGQPPRPAEEFPGYAEGAEGVSGRDPSKTGPSPPKGPRPAAGAGDGHQSGQQLTQQQTGATDGEWQKLEDNGRMYYFNQQTGETRWDQ